MAPPRPSWSAPKELSCGRPCSEWGDPALAPGGSFGAGAPKGGSRTPPPPGAQVPTFAKVYLRAGEGPSWARSGGQLAWKLAWSCGGSPGTPHKPRRGRRGKGGLPGVGCYAGARHALKHPSQIPRVARDEGQAQRETPAHGRGLRESRGVRGRGRGRGAGSWCNREDQDSLPNDAP
jgi:hypothetical protein